MTKKHFILIAQALKDNNANLALVKALALVFAQINPLFDTGKFIKASIKE